MVLGNISHEYCLSFRYYCIVSSPGHPLSDGGFFSDIYVGSFVDDSEVIIVESIHNPEGLTYDILPSGETGLYWANDILVQSTLFPVKQGLSITFQNN